MILVIGSGYIGDVECYQCGNVWHTEIEGECMSCKNDEENKVDENLIKGCQSKVWIHAELSGDAIEYTADSDAILTKVIVALVLRVFSDQQPKDILAANTDFINELGLTEHLSPTRTNGLVSLIQQIKLSSLT